MNIKKIYSELYITWLTEFQNETLRAISKEEFDNYKESYLYLQKYPFKEEDDIKHQIFMTIKENFEFLFNDLLKLRKEKILNASLSLKTIEINKLLESERLLYQNVVSSIKGYEKVLTLSLLDDTFKKIALSDKVQEIEQVAESESQIKEINEIVPEQMPQSPHSKHDEPPYVMAPSLETDQDTDNEYVLIRFLKKTPALMGIDLLYYGPFEKEDIGFLPMKNAKILIVEKFADPISME